MAVIHSVLQLFRIVQRKQWYGSLFQAVSLHYNNSLGEPLPILPQHGLYNTAVCLAPRHTAVLYRPCWGMLIPPRIKNPPRIWEGYGPDDIAYLC